MDIIASRLAKTNITDVDKANTAFFAEVQKLHKIAKSDKQI